MPFDLIDINVTDGGVLVVGYLNPIPDSLSFVFPVFYNHNENNKPFIYTFNENHSIRIYIEDFDDFCHIHPITINDPLASMNLDSIFAYEFMSGAVWIGSADMLADKIVKFLSGSSTEKYKRMELHKFLDNFLLCKTAPLRNYLQHAKKIDKSEFSHIINTPRVGINIKVIGIGNAGGTMLQHMTEGNSRVIDYIYANTDKMSLSESEIPQRIHLGYNELGAGGNPQKGLHAAELVQNQIRNAIQGASILFILAGMGGGTGSGAAPAVARIAKEMGILTVGMVTTPFELEGVRRLNNSRHGLVELEENVDSLIVLNNQKLFEVLDDNVTLNLAFRTVNDLIKSTIDSIVDVVSCFGEERIDFEDICTVMSARGRAMMGTASASGVHRAMVATKEAVTSPLMQSDIFQAQGVLVLVSASRESLKLSEYAEIINIVSNTVSSEAHVICGKIYDESLGEVIRVTVIATGLSRQSLRLMARPLEALRTGTDHTAFYQNTNSDLQNFATSNTKNPSVWSHRVIEASKVVNELKAQGLEDFEIPAFLRRQAD